MMKLCRAQAACEGFILIFFHDFLNVFLFPPSLSLCFIYEIASGKQREREGEKHIRKIQWEKLFRKNIIGRLPMGLNLHYSEPI